MTQKNIKDFQDEEVKNNKVETPKKDQSEEEVTKETTQDTAETVELTTQEQIDALQAEMNALAAEVDATQDVDKRAKFFELKVLRNELRTQL